MNTLQRVPQAKIVPTAGQRMYSRLNSGVQTHFIALRLQADLTIATAAADAIRNRGSICAIFDELGLDENGKDRVLLYGPVARALSEAASPSKLSAKRVTSTAIGATHLDEVVRIYFAHPFAVNPRETAFRDHDARAILQVFAKLAASGGADRLVKTSGASVATLANLSIQVLQGMDAQEPGKPFFIPQYRQEIEPVSGANTALRHYLKTSYPIRAIVVSQETTTDGEASDVLNGIVLRGDARDIIGPSEESAAFLALDSEFELGGDSGYSNGQPHIVLNFQTMGRLKNVLSPNQDVNLRAELDVQPGAGLGASQVRFTIVELVPDPALCAPVPFPI